MTDVLLPEFKPWPKIPRANRPLIITEKIDGTSAIIHIDSEDDFPVLTAGSRTRWLATMCLAGPGFMSFEPHGKDNFGFAEWCRLNYHELIKLGPGYHYGEWYGQGIQRGYGLTERRLALFNTSRWNPDNPNRPACCEVVPVLAFDAVSEALEFLRTNGSVAVPGFMKPEGVVVFHTSCSTRRLIRCRKSC